MKIKHIIAFVIFVVGTNVFTYATTRYWTTAHVLNRGQSNMEAALKREGLYEAVYLSQGPNAVQLRMAIRGAGGMYYWYNDGLIYWGAGALLMIIGALIPLVESGKNTKIQT